MKTYREQIADRCQHFRSIFHNKTCTVGVEYEAVRDPGARPIALPCFKSKGLTTCPKAQFPTDAELDATIAEHNRHTTKLFTAPAAAKEHAKANGLKKRHGGLGDLPCPACHTGTLYYSVASLNGHMHGKCSTTGCVSWME